MVFRRKCYDYVMKIYIFLLLILQRMLRKFLVINLYLFFFQLMFISVLVVFVWMRDYLNNVLILIVEIRQALQLMIDFFYRVFLDVSFCYYCFQLIRRWCFFVIIWKVFFVYGSFCCRYLYFLVFLLRCVIGFREYFWVW